MDDNESPPTKPTNIIPPIHPPVTIIPEDVTITDNIVYDALNNPQSFIIYGGITIVDEVPADWPCQWFSFDTVRGIISYETGEYKIKRIITVVLFVFLYISTSSMDSVLFTRLSKTLITVTLLLTEFIYPAAFTMVIWPMLLIRKIYQYWCLNEISFGKSKAGGKRYDTILHGNSKDDHIKLHSIRRTNNHIKSKDPISDDEDDISIDPEIKYTCSFVNRRYIFIMTVLALCDTLSTIFMIPPVIFMDPILLMIFKQIYIPINMFVAWLYAGKTYKPPHYVGVGMILVSVVTMILSQNQTKDKSFSFSKIDILWLLLIIISIFPASFGQNYKEWHLKEKNLDVWCVTAFVNTIQLVMNLPLLFLVLIPIPEYIPSIMMNISSHVNSTDKAPLTQNMETVLEFTRPIVWDNLGSYIKFSFQCIFGDFGGFYPTNILNQTNHTLNDFVDNGIQCHWVGMTFSIFIIINVLFNVFQTNLIKLTTANISALVSVITLILTNLLFGIPLLSGPAYRQPKIWDFVSLAGAGLGLINFWSVPEILPKKVLKSRTAPYMDDNVGDSSSRLSNHKKCDCDYIAEKTTCCCLYWVFGFKNCCRDKRKFQKIISLQSD